MVNRIDRLNGAGRERARGRRRGVLLLVVLSMLVLFTIIAVTFVLIAGQYRREMRNAPIVERYGVSPRQLLDSGLRDLLRGSSNATSPIQHHSLLEDVYGANTGSGVVASVVQQAGGQLLDLTFTSSGTLSAINGYYNGMVLTMTSGPARGQSTRIVGYSYIVNNATTPPTTTTTFRVLAFEEIAASEIYNAVAAQRFIVNGRAFNGTGVGYNNTAVQTFPRTASGTNTLLDAQDSNSMFYALMPNAKYFQPFGNYTSLQGPGGANEDYDAPDPQNMAIAWQPVGVSLPAQILPSFHRPDLVSWWATNAATSTAWSANTGYVQEKVVLRPLQTDHPLFTGSNPAFTLTTGPWDVDNDGDGIPDSVWIDPGYPVQTAPDGTQYKALFAYLVQDMDGRLNVNAHGNAEQTQVNQTGSNGASSDAMYNAYTQGPLALTTNTQTYKPSAMPPSTLATSIAGATATTNEVLLPRGPGYGPPEINLGYGITGATTSNLIFPTIAQYQDLHFGYPGATAATTYDGRNGEDGTATSPLPGQTTTSSSSSDMQSEFKHIDFPYGFNLYSSYGGGLSYYQPATYSWTSYGTPSDLWGRGTVGLDFRGQPLYLYASPLLGAAARELPNSPYALNLSRQAVRAGVQALGVDNPYTPEELERILRRFDVDSYSRADRLRTILEGGFAGSVTPNYLLRQLITTDSYDTPTPNMQPPSEQRVTVVGNLGTNTLTTTTSPPSVNIADILAAKLLQNGGGTYGAPATATSAAAPNTAAINVQLTMMLPPELMAGQYMDLNRPFGNGRDGNSNNVVDEPNEYATEAAWGTGWDVNAVPSFPSVNLSSLPTGTVAFNLLNGVDVNYAATSTVPDNYKSFTNSGLSSPYNSPQYYARQIYARHLYVLMMLLVDQGFVTLPGTAPATAQGQWGNQNADFAGQPKQNNFAATTQQELTSRRIAQWAINAADFRDEDSIMTPFEYDANPFDGWNVDGIVGTADDTNTERRLVWGCEYPELLISETFAMHDRRVRDTMNDNGAGPFGPNQPRFNQNSTPPPPIIDKWQETDSTLDQIRVPQGSLFVELYCPRPNNAGTGGGTQSVYPGDLYYYSTANSQWYLNLGKMSPDGLNPVWRLVVASSNNQLPKNNLALRMTTNPATTTLDPPGDPYSCSVFNVVNSANNPDAGGYMQYERIAWFANVAPVASTNTASGVNGRIYYNQGIAAQTAAAAATTPSVLLQPGGYAVLGPRTITTFGRLTNTGMAQNPPFAISPQAIILNPSSNNTANNTRYFNITAAPANLQSVEYISTGSLNSANSTVGVNIQQPLAIICAGGLPVNAATGAWANGANTATMPGNAAGGIGISVSEPVFSSTYYYQEPKLADSSSQAVKLTPNLIDAYGSDSAAVSFLDQPYETKYYNSTAPNTTQIPLNVDAIQATGTYLNYKTVLLQRLANPLLAYNPMPGGAELLINNDTIGGTGVDPHEQTYNSSLPVNPYITVDWMPVNLTVFNGDQFPLAITTYTSVGAINPNTGPTTTTNISSVDPDDAAYASTGTPVLPLARYMQANSNSFGPYPTDGAGAFGTGQRGSTAAGSTAMTALNLWSPYEDLFSSGSGNNTNANSVFPCDLYGSGTSMNGQTLGFLNRAFAGTSGAGHPWSTGDAIPAPANYVGDVNPNFWMTAQPASGTAFASTFPWINWNNRPYVSHFELLQVPASSPTRLMWEFGFTGNAAMGELTGDLYGATGAASGQPATLLTPFTHLLNFAMTAQQSTTLYGTAPHLYRLFEYARVPSRFVGTDIVLSPGATTPPITATAGSVFPDQTAETLMFSYLHPPFNKVSRQRDPGKVNLNTIPQSSLLGTSTDATAIVWNAIVDSPPLAPATSPQSLGGPVWSQVENSLHGGATTITASTYPSWFINPFRSFAGADLGLPGGPMLRGVDATLMRPNVPGTLGSVSTSNQMLFDFPPPATTGATTYQAYNAPDRNSYFRYQNLQRLGNLTTTRSNVYAVWITVGYFKVLPWTNATTGVTGPDFIHPDGYQLADELGSDSGNTQRHRAFYMIDRTIPVGFERGVDHNVERAIVLKRFIE